MSAPPTWTLRDAHKGRIEAPPSKDSERCTKAEPVELRVAPAPVAFVLPAPPVELADREPRLCAEPIDRPRRIWLPDHRKAIRRMRPGKLLHDAEPGAPAA